MATVWFGTLATIFICETQAQEQCEILALVTEQKLIYFGYFKCAWNSHCFMKSMGYILYKCACRFGVKIVSAVSNLICVSIICSLGGQWFRICPAMEGTRVRSPGHGTRSHLLWATKSLHNLEPDCFNKRSLPCNN